MLELAISPAAGEEQQQAVDRNAAKKSNQGFVEIATAILSLEILASSFAGWTALYPEAGASAHAVLKRQSGGSQTPLMEFYLYPAENVSSAAIAKLTPPRTNQTGEFGLNRTSKPELAGERLALGYVNKMLQKSDDAALLEQH
ncbi:hypothetical protein ACVIGB_000156 [Bradyrhizobium sp. USDA 4341]